MAVQVFTDGGSRGNPGHASAGIYIPEFNIRAGYYLGPSVTNNVAEYSALILALIKAKVHGWSDLAIFADSKLMVEQMKGSYAVKSEKILPLYKEAQSYADRLKSITYTHIPRVQNKIADAEVNRVLDAVGKGEPQVVYRFG